MKKNLQKSSDPTSRKSHVDLDDDRITIKRQAELLSINRSSLYRDALKTKVYTELDIFITNRIDERPTAHPTWGYRTITFDKTQVSHSKG